MTGAMKARYSQYKSLIADATGSQPTLSHYPYLLPSVLAHESGFNAAAVNHDSNGTEDMGIAQLNSGYYQSSVAYDPTQAIPEAASILNTGLEQCGSVSGALQYYNGGHCGADVGSYIADVSQFFGDFGGKTASPGKAAATTGSNTSSAIKSVAASAGKTLFGTRTSTVEEILFTLGGLGLLLVAFAKL